MGHWLCCKCLTACGQCFQTAHSVSDTQILQSCLTVTANASCGRQQQLHALPLIIKTTVKCCCEGSCGQAKICRMTCVAAVWLLSGLPGVGVADTGLWLCDTGVFETPASCTVRPATGAASCTGVCTTNVVRSTGAACCQLEEPTASIHTTQRLSNLECLYCLIFA